MLFSYVCSLCLLEVLSHLLNGLLKKGFSLLNLFAELIEVLSQVFHFQRIRIDVAFPCQHSDQNSKAKPDGLADTHHVLY